MRGDRKSQPPRPLVPSEDGNGEPGTPPPSHPHQLADTERVTPQVSHLKNGKPSAVSWGS